MTTKYPYIQIEKYGDYHSAIIHLSDDTRTLALPTRVTLMEKMDMLVKEKKITRFHMFEFIRKAVLGGMITAADETEDFLPVEFKNQIDKILLKKVFNNPYSPTTCIVEKDINGTKHWYFSSPNQHSFPFTSKKEGKKELQELLEEPEGNATEIEQMFKMLHDSKDIPGELEEKRNDVN